MVSLTGIEPVSITRERLPAGERKLTGRLVVGNCAPDCALTLSASPHILADYGLSPSQSGTQVHGRGQRLESLSGMRETPRLSRNLRGREAHELLCVSCYLVRRR
jgi:hypothetical protein